MNIMNLFPTAVAQSKMDDELSDEELNFIVDQEKEKNSNNVISKNKYILKSDELSRLNFFIEQKLNEYFKQIYSPGDRCQIYITQSWCNYTEKNQSHHIHAHANSIVSGVFYVKTDQDDKIIFHSQKQETIKIEPEEYNLYNSSTWWLSTPENYLFLFPSNLIHNVPTVENDHMRISLSFNTFVSGRLGRDEDATGLNLFRG